MGTLAHDALFYETTAQYDAAVLAFVRDGLHENEPVLVAVPEPNLSRIRAALPPDVLAADMAVAGRNPGRIIGGVLTAFVRAHPGRRVRATRTHPVLAHGPDRWPSPCYTDPCLVAPSFDRPLSPAPRDADVLVVDRATGPRAARRFVHEFAERAGLAPERNTDLRRIVQELAVNTIVHSGGAGLLTVWCAAGHVIVQVHDGGRFDDPLAGRRPPSPPEVGHGLYLVHALAELVRIHHGAHGTVVRVHIGLR